MLQLPNLSLKKTETHLRNLAKLPGQGLHMVQLLLNEEKPTLVLQLFKMLPKLKSKKVSLDTPVLRHSPYKNNGYNRASHNCFAYALNLRSKKFSNMFLQVSRGMTTFSSIVRGAKNDIKKACKGCDKIMKQLIPGISEIDFKTTCKRGHHKICMVVSLGDNDNNGSDFHFLRLNKIGLWSHKPGSTPITATDKNNRLIFNPSDKSMRFEVNGHPYQFCHFYSVPVQTEKNIAHIQGLETPSKKQQQNLNMIQLLTELSNRQNIKLYSS